MTLLCFLGRASSWALRLPLLIGDRCSESAIYLKVLLPDDIENNRGYWAASLPQSLVVWYGNLGLQLSWLREQESRHLSVWRSGYFLTSTAMLSSTLKRNVWVYNCNHDSLRRSIRHCIVLPYFWHASTSSYKQYKVDDILFRHPFIFC